MTRIDFVGRGLLLSAILLLAACSTGSIKPTPPPLVGAPVVNVVDPGNLVVHTLPIGAGNCQIAQCPSGNRLVVMDCGSKGAGTQDWDAGKVKGYVETLIDDKSEITVSISHPDEDHYNYIAPVFANMKVTSLYLGGDWSQYNSTFQDWVKTQRIKSAAQVNMYTGFYASATPEPGLSCWKPEHGGSSMQVASYILGVNAGTTKNDGSMVVAMRYGDFTTTFTGDMTQATENKLQLPNGLKSFKANLLTGAHHGASSQGSNSVEWAKATSPDFVIFSAGLRYSHPRCDAVDRYTTVGAALPEHEYFCGNSGTGENRKTTDNILVTDSNGLIVIEADTHGAMKVLPVKF
ncbi:MULTISPECIES: ComEC/Rec2 family competence protein [Stenotrophomonas]|uniref:Metallo-beta-lactamase domain-containing protein n=1 Tax=Stenotrophomonas maltophilia TaxID=40324 RepID=A0A2J0T2B2_STEMA|nr:MULTISPECIES: hypothetical protein [Stenotrophomonas]MBA0309984.1 hypothetical protein [Stenotrophomonas maltophilia]MBH1408174.1 hypothetical protein [Stenotrophomonas maltophilia]MBH1744295.1 hypothetical protein [Stenotrophomonas maltophilia]MBH1863624.1 hypothetical protein [Stenotrophomonas maltophilia]MDH1388027.1 hypothetical protein [Stenotrophomonas sp. GD03701]